MWRKNIPITLIVYMFVVSNLFEVFQCADPDEETIVEVVDDQADPDKVVGKIQGQISEEERYVKLFEHQRAIQLDAVKSLKKSKMKYDQKYKLNEMMVKDLFKVLEQAKDNLTEWGFVPGDPYPNNKTVQDSISQVFESTAMFGDLILRMPDMTHAIYDKNKHWEFLIGWAVWFSMESGVFKGPHEELLTLMSMELGLIPKGDSFVNPYKDIDGVQVVDETSKDMEERKKKQNAERIKKKSEKTKAKRKGPKLSGVQHTEL